MTSVAKCAILKLSKECQLIFSAMPRGVSVNQEEDLPKGSVGSIVDSISNNIEKVSWIELLEITKDATRSSGDLNLP